MAETLGTLCDKLTIVLLKSYHTDSEEKLESLKNQKLQLQFEIDDFLSEAITGNIPVSKLSFDSNKVYKKEGNEINEISGGIGEIFAELANVNCELWHEQEKVYDFKNVPLDKKDQVINQLAKLNLKRNKCIDKIDFIIKEVIIERNNK